MANIFVFTDNSDPVEQAKDALRAVRQYHRDWQDYGINRVYKYFEVEQDN